MEDDEAVRHLFLENRCEGYESSGHETPQLESFLDHQEDHQIHGENLPVLQISDYEDFPLPFNLEDLLDSSSVTIESLLNSPPPQPIASAESIAGETGTNLMGSPFSDVEPFSIPSSIPAAFYNDSSLISGPDSSRMPLSSPNTYSSVGAHSSQVNQIVRQTINHTQPNFPWVPPSSSRPNARIPRNSFDIPTQHQQFPSARPRSFSNGQNVLIHEIGQEGRELRMQDPSLPVMQLSLVQPFHQLQRPPIRFPAPPFVVKQEPMTSKQEQWIRRPEPMKQEPSFIKCEPVFEKLDLREVAELERDVMVIKQEEPWHQQLLRQQHQQLVSPQLEKQRGERRALVDKLLREMAVKMDQEPNHTQQDMKEPLLEVNTAMKSEVVNVGTSFPFQVEPLKRSPSQQRPESGYHGSPLSFHSSVSFPSPATPPPSSPPSTSYPFLGSPFPTNIPNIHLAPMVKIEPPSLSDFHEAILKSTLYGQKVGLPFVQEGLVKERFPMNFEPVIKEEKKAVGGQKIDGKMVYQCSECCKRFGQLSNLRVHYRTHTQVRPYSCYMQNKYGGSCGKTFKQLAHLQKHLMIHSGVKPHPCAYCEKRFSSSSNLKTHERVHKMEKPYVCNICEDRFTQHIHLKQHVVRVHGQKKPHPCHSCTNAYFTKSSLNQHLKSTSCGK